MTRFAPKYVFTLFVLFVALFAARVPAAEATHFLGGQLSWQRDFSYSDPNNYRYTVTFDLFGRWSYPWLNGTRPPINGTLQGDFAFVISGTGINQSIQPTAIVRSINASEDWFVAQAVFQIIVPRTSLPVAITFDNCCRTSTLKESNNDVNMTLKSVIPSATVDGTPRTTMLPRVYGTANELLQIQMPLLGFGGFATRVGFSSQSESSLVTITPVGQNNCTNNCPPTCNNSSGGLCAPKMSVSTTGLIQWLPQVAGLYAVQFRLFSVDANNVVVSSTPIDMTFAIEPPCSGIGCPTPPVIAALPATTSAMVGQQLNLNITVTDTNPTDTLTLVPTALPAGASLQTLTIPTSSPATFRLSWTPSAAQVGSYPVCFQANDNTGRTSLGQACTTIVVTQNQPPIVQCVAPSPLTALSPSGIQFTPVATVFDPESMTIASFQEFVNDTLVATLTNILPNQQPLITGAPLLFPIGTTQVRFTATDTFGATASCTMDVVVDRLPQTIQYQQPAAPIGFGTAPQPVPASATSGLPVSLQVLSGPGAITGGLLSFNGVGTIEVKVTQDGDQVYAPAAPAILLYHVIDVHPPVIDPHAPVNEEATGATGAIVNYQSPAVNDDVTQMSGPAACVPASGSTFPIGATTVACTAQDEAGNAASTSFVVTVADTRPPAIDPHGDETGSATSAAGGVVTYALPSAHDVVDGDVAVSCAPSSGATFPLGGSSVTCTASDSHGNTATASFSVTVSDATPPAIAPHGDEHAEATSAAGAAVVYATPAGSDAVDGAVAVVCVPASGSTFPIGSTPVACTASDAAGNHASSSFGVTVTDTTPPVIAAHGNESAAATSAAGAVVTFTTPSASDAVDGSVIVTCAPASGSLFAVGTTTVTCSAADVHGNAASRSFTVTVSNVTTPGDMRGDGFVRDDDAKYFFSFYAREKASGSERARLSVRIDEDGWKWFRKHNRDRDRHNRDDRFQSTSVESIEFSDDPTIRPGRNRKPQIDTVLFRGSGEWNGRRGYRYEVFAQDAGEPGRHRESIKVTIWSPSGQVVAQFEGDLDGGNIQSGRIRH